jgi:hypothetical protein
MATGMLGEEGLNHRLLCCSSEPKHGNQLLHQICVAAAALIKAEFVPPILAGRPAHATREAGEHLTGATLQISTGKGRNMASQGEL